MENPEYISLKRDIILSSLIETEEDSEVTQYINFIQDIIDRSIIKKKDGAILYTSETEPRDWYIFLNDGYTTINRSIYEHFLRHLLYMNEDQILDIINIIINMLLNIENTSRLVESKFAEFYYMFFYDYNITTSNSTFKLKILNSYSITTD